MLDPGVVSTFKEDQRAFDGKTVPNLALFWMAVSIAGGRSSDISQQLRSKFISLVVLFIQPNYTHTSHF